MKAYKFRVLLDSNKEEEVFRDVLIKSDDHFESLYQQIINSFSFKGDEMASFYISNEEWEKGFEINLMDMGMPDEGLPNVMSKARIQDYIESEDQKIILVYDFFKMWCFLIELQETVETKETDLPKTLLAVGTPPDENDENNEGKILKGEDLSGFDDDLGDDFGDDFDSLDDMDDIADDSNYY